MGILTPWLLDEISKWRFKIDECEEYKDWISTHDMCMEPSPRPIIGPVSKAGVYPIYDEAFATEAKMNANMKFLASKMDLKIPLTPVHTKEEQALFKKLSDNRATMLDKFNKKADGNAIFYKNQPLMDKHWKSRKSAMQLEVRMT